MFTDKMINELNELLNKPEKLTRKEVKRKKQLLNLYDYYIIEKSDNDYLQSMLSNWY